MPREMLTRARIVRSAVELLDLRGLEELSMRALGKRLDSAATAVYWHVGSKEDLIGLAADHVWGEIPLPDLTVTDWRTAATQMATDLRAMLTRHAWLVQALGSLVLYGPGKARHDDHNLAIYEAAGFTGRRIDQAAAAVFTFVLGNALGNVAAASLAGKLRRRHGGGAKSRMRDAMTRAREVAETFPRLRARIDGTAAEYGASPDQTFELGLEALLDGLETRRARASKPAARTKSKDRSGR